MNKKTSKKRIILLPCIIVAAVAVDQFIKVLVLRSLALQTPTRSFLGIRLQYTRNTGVAFSMLREHPQILELVIAVILIACIVYLFAEPNRPYSQSVCLALICAGGAGNLIDRLRLGFVVDYIEPVFIRFAIFNFADILLTCSVALWAFMMLRDILRERRKQV